MITKKNRWIQQCLFTVASALMLAVSAAYGAPPVVDVFPTNDSTPVLSGVVNSNDYQSLSLAFNGTTWTVSNLNAVTLSGFLYDRGSGAFSLDLSDVGLSPAPVAMSVETNYDVAVTGYPQVNLAGTPTVDVTTNEVTYDITASFTFRDAFSNWGDDEWNLRADTDGIEDGRIVTATADGGGSYTQSIITYVEIDEDEIGEFDATFTFTGWPDGTVTVSAVSSDLAGNVASNSVLRVLDTFAQISVTQPLFGDDYLLSGELPGGALTGTTLGVETGQTIVVTVTDQNGLSTSVRTPVDAAGNWSAPLSDFILETVLEKPALANDSYVVQDVAVFDDGSFVICWARKIDSEPLDLWHQRFSSSGAPLSTQEMVNATNSASEWSVSVAALEDQGYVVAWHESGIKYRRYNSNGVAVAETVNMVTGTAYNYTPNVLGLSDGGWVITWEGGLNNDRAVFQKRFDVAGTGGPTVEVSHDPDTIDDYRASIAGLADDGWVVAWKKSSIPSDGTDEEIFTQRYNSDGNTNAVGFTMVNAPDTQSDADPSVSGLTNGGWVVAWRKVGGAGDGDDSEIIFQQFNSNGVAVGSNTKVDAADSYDDYSPAVTALPDGGWAIVWDSSDSDGLGDAAHNIYLQRYNSEGVAATNMDVRVNTADTAADQRPSIATFPGGGWVVSWQDSWNKTISFRLFDADGNGTAFEDLAAGPLDISVTVQDEAWNSATGTASIVMDLSGLFESWTDSHGLTEPNAFFTADPDGDGAANGYEWATGTSPTNSGSIALLGIGSANTDAVVSFTRNTNATNVAILLQRSLNLVSNVWNGIATNTAGSWSPPGIVTETGTGNPVDVEITNTHTNQPAAFYRLRVE